MSQRPRDLLTHKPPHLLLGIGDRDEVTVLVYQHPVEHVVQRQLGLALLPDGVHQDQPVLRTEQRPEDFIPPRVNLYRLAFLVLEPALDEPCGVLGGQGRLTHPLG